MAINVFDTNSTPYLQGGCGRRRATAACTITVRLMQPQVCRNMNGIFFWIKKTVQIHHHSLLLSFCPHPFPGKEQNNNTGINHQSLSVSSTLKAISAGNRKGLARKTRLTKMKNCFISYLADTTETSQMSILSAHDSNLAASFPGHVGDLGMRLVVYQGNRWWRFYLQLIVLHNK